MSTLLDNACGIHFRFEAFFVGGCAQSAAPGFRGARSGTGVGDARDRDGKRPLEELLPFTCQESNGRATYPERSRPVIGNRIATFCGPRSGRQSSSACGDACAERSIAFRLCVPPLLGEWGYTASASILNPKCNPKCDQLSSSLLWTSDL
jgi:hypothetical protein